MLDELRLRGLGVIDDATLEFGPGFTAVTGETGAGKTMVLTGLGLLLGGRADAALVRPGRARAEVEGVLRVDPAGAAATRALDAGAHLDDDALVIARTVSGDARSRAFVGGRSVPAAVLADLADDLVAVHGQADQRGLLRPTVQRDVLDRFGGAELATLLTRYRETFDQLSSVRTRLHEVTTRRRERAREADLLRFGLAEIDAVNPTPGEDDAVRADIERLGHVELLRSAADAAHEALSTRGSSDSVDALTLLGAARHALEEARGRDAALDALAGRLAEASYLVADLSADLASYSDSIEADPQRLEAAQQRLAALSALTRKYAGDVAGVLQWATDARSGLADLEGDDERVEQLTAEHAALLRDVTAIAQQLSAARRAAASRLEREVTAELAALAMPHAALTVDVSHRDDPAGLFVDGAHVAFGRSGIDDVELLLVPHAGASPRPLRRGASGGELSRVMLALEVVLAGTDPVSTFVFDEVDAGVGGRAAVEVGRRLAMLARTAQVIVVTHLPQVAAFADRHLVVRKNDDGTVTSSGVHAVDGEDRLEELSRMLAGLPDSALGRGHAEELLAAAAAAKSDV